MGLVKFSVFFFNMVFALCGLALLGLGVYILVKTRSYTDITDKTVLSAPVLLICMGGSIQLVASLGCCGAYRENRACLMLFALLLVLLLLAMLAGTAYAVLYKAELKDRIGKAVVKSFNKYKASGGVRKTWDYTQKHLKCCGANSTKDWYLVFKNLHTVPDSCCVKVSKDCGVKYKSDKLHKSGCMAKVQMLIASHLTIFIGVYIGLAFVLVLGIVLACKLGGYISHAHTYGRRF